MRNIIIHIRASYAYRRIMNYITQAIAVILYFIGIKPHMAIMVDPRHPYGGDIICCGYWEVNEPRYSYAEVVFNLPFSLARSYQAATYRVGCA